MANREPPEPARAGPSNPDSPPLRVYTLPEALARLRCGRTWLLNHLRAHPMHAGRPTHHKAGRKIILTEEDLRTLLETMVPKPREARPSNPPPPPRGDLHKLLKRLEDQHEREKVERKRRELEGRRVTDRATGLTRPLTPREIQAELRTWFATREKIKAGLRARRGQQ